MGRFSHWKRKNSASGPGSPSFVSLSYLLFLGLRFLICKLGRGKEALEDHAWLLKCSPFYPVVFPEAKAGAQALGLRSGFPGLEAAGSAPGLGGERRAWL